MDGIKGFAPLSNIGRTVFNDGMLRVAIVGKKLLVDTAHKDAEGVITKLRGVALPLKEIAGG